LTKARRVIIKQGMASRLLRLFVIVLALGGTSAPSLRGSYAEVATTAATTITATCATAVGARAHRGAPDSAPAPATAASPADVVLARAAVSVEAPPLPTARLYRLHRALLL
jgi:hypothetical protein